MSDPCLELTPDARARPAARAGTAVEIDGRIWTLAAAIPYLGDVWDRLFDQNHLAGYYDPDDLRMAAFRLLYAHYHVTPDEGVALIQRAPLGALVAAIEAALFGGVDYLGYSNWIEVQLWSNGIDPERLPARLRLAVLDNLVTTGRALPAAQYVSSAEAAAVRQSFPAPR